MATFKDTFAAAKKAGKETFIYDGKLYTTEVAVKDADETKFEAVTNIERDTYMYDTYFYRVIMSKITGHEFYY